MARTDLRKHAPLALEMARALWDEGKTYREIATRLKLTKGQVAGLAFRHNFPKRDGWHARPQKEAA